MNSKWSVNLERVIRVYFDLFENYKLFRKEDSMKFEVFFERIKKEKFDFN